MKNYPIFFLAEALQCVDAKFNLRLHFAILFPDLLFKILYPESYAQYCFIFLKAFRIAYLIAFLQGSIDCSVDNTWTV